MEEPDIHVRQTLLFQNMGTNTVPLLHLGQCERLIMPKTQRLRRILLSTGPCLTGSPSDLAACTAVLQAIYAFTSSKRNTWR